ncbi:MAG: glycosyltransferase, partial [Terriglobales bacterium]
MGTLLHLTAEAAAAGRAVSLLGGEAFSPESLQTGETPLQGWARCLRERQPAAVIVHDPGPLPPEALWQLREREIPYALALTEFLQICPTRRLWHRRGEICSGPSRNGLKCALCATPGKLDWPLALPQLRQRPQRWQAAMAGAEALLAPSRFVRDAWLNHGAPADRLIVLPPLAAAELAPGPSLLPERHPRALVYTGSWDDGDGASWLAEALVRMEAPVQLLAVGDWDGESQAGLRAAVPARHGVEFPGQLGAAALHLCLLTAAAAVIPSRWQQTYGPLLDAAQWAGAVPVATALGAMPERIIHGLNGLLAEPADPASLAEALEAAFAAVWDAAAARRQRQTEAAVTLATWRDLAAGLPRRPPNLALHLAYGPLLDAAEEAFGLSAEQAAQQLRTALEMPEMDSIEPAEQAFLQAAPTFG